jgi:hypothetical protein
VYLAINIYRREKKKLAGYACHECRFINMHPGIFYAILKCVRDSYKSYEYLLHNKSARNGGKNKISGV